MKKILIFYASYGGGHLTAAKSMQNYIEANYGNVDIELIDCIKYVNIAIDKVTTMAYKQIATKAPWAWGRIYSDAQKGPLAHLSSRSNKILAIKLLRLLREKRPDLIISTHPFGTQMCSYLKRKGKITSKIATIMTDFAPHDQWLVGNDFNDYFFVAHNKMKNYLLSKEIPESKIYVTGIPISNKFNQTFDKSEIYKSLGFSENKKTVLFFGGGEYGLGKSRTVNIFKAFVKYFDNLQIIAIAGRNPKMQEAFQTAVDTCDKNDFVKILEYTDKVPEYMAISDLVVTKPGGLTTSESLASNLPMIIINPIPGQEEENAEFLEEKGIAVWIRKDDDPKSIIKNLLNDEKKLATMMENTNILANKNASRDICKILL
ncbi:MAG: UDP-N-acetylglucosamine 2-epimerase [Clostridia bacterium]|nr:UDP-N-acetylglucosamine 2-epimerase [Clostridia bacterium]